ncbi:ion transporter [Aestuariispira insulae]|uniref:Voltage-gated sodium channel n=1 Tax=Aestuariispira insulae TaxID=1461337 RepID=A0A3D9HRP3_9PROT|nr:ion transporter [Aestuariispira insulae]RED52162.1 voltage-gated sodium channel [Aestuariispira insulae]
MTSIQESRNGTRQGPVERVGRFVESEPVQKVIIALVVINAIILGLETVPPVFEAYGRILVFLDQTILAVFVAEILAKLAWRRHRFFLNGWNLFDFVIVGIALVPASGGLSVLRALRILRAFRLISAVPQMRRVVGALFSAIPGIMSVGAIIMLIFYVSAVLATSFFGPKFPEWFGGLGESFYTLFQVMTLESWSMGIVRPVMAEYPLAWVFFVPFILITSFAVLNLFIGIIVDAMQSQHEEEEEHIQQGMEKLLREQRDEIRALREDMAKLREAVEERRANGRAD